MDLEQHTQPVTPHHLSSTVPASYAGTIADACSKAGLDIAQLHGDGARAAVWDLPEHLQVIYVMHVDASGRLQTPQPAQLAEAAGQQLSRFVARIFPCRFIRYFIAGRVGGSGLFRPSVSMLYCRDSAHP